MNIFITLDYEIYFGENTGSVEKCLLEPTKELSRIADKYNVKFCFFVDSGFLIKLDEYRKKYSVLDKDYQSVIAQIEQLSKAGHDIQLHIHPHWEDSYFNGERWIINTKRYKLTDFNQHDIADIVKRYKKVLTDITDKNIFVNRAGGWCLQPFSELKDILKDNGISVDSTVFKNGYHTTSNYFYDFRKVPNKTSWDFENDPTRQTTDGSFKEFAIGSMKVSPLFFWKLFLLGRLNPHFHKPLGDGRAMENKGFRRKLLTSFTHQTVSIDGYNAKLLQKALNSSVKKNIGNEFVVIGHPKALSRFSLVQLDKFIQDNIAHHSFTNFINYCFSK